MRSRVYLYRSLHSINVRIITSIFALIPLQEDELREIIEMGRAMEDSYGHYFDYVIIHYDHERAYSELLQEIYRIQNEAQWVPLTWLNS